MLLDNANTLRYCRHILLPQVQEEGQETIMASHILVVGAGGLGSAVLPYLVAAGVGRITLFDHDTVDVTNLQRQILHTEDNVGQLKVKSAKQQLTALNSQVEITTYASEFTKDHESQLISADVIVDCSDNLTTRLLLNRLCWEHKTPLISGSAIRMEGQLVHFPMRDDDPCYACVARLFKEPSLSCMEAGVLAPVVGTMGSLQATEALKSLLKMTPKTVTMLLYDAEHLTFNKFVIPKHPHCEVCAER
ncbi:MAG: HesA/MoeB/ThiF family protein [Pseudoalteromonas shioyasakiensis]